MNFLCEIQLSQYDKSLTLVLLPYLKGGLNLIIDFKHYTHCSGHAAWQLRAVAGKCFKKAIFKGFFCCLDESDLIIFVFHIFVVIFQWYSAVYTERYFPQMT